MKHTINAVLAAEQFDEKGNLRPAAMLRLFQDAADAHGHLMGVGFEAMLERKLLWVVTQIRFQVTAELRPGQAVSITTWPLPATRLGFERNYLIQDENGQTLVKGTSLWTVIDTETRRMAIGADLYPDGEFCLDKTFPERARRLRDFEAPAACTVIPGEEYIDCNGHVNNTYYAAFAETALGGLPGKVTDFQIDYLHEVLSGQPLTLSTCIEGATAQVKGTSSDGTRMFACAFTLDEPLSKA